MRLFCLASLVAVATAFTSQPNAFTVTTSVVGERASSSIEQSSSSAHRTRRATIVMDGKANGE